MLRHIVFFKLKNISDTDRAVKALKVLKENIPFIRALQVGVNEISSPRACDIALTVDLDSLEDLEKYRTHEHHVPVVKLMGELCERSHVVDYNF